MNEPPAPGETSLPDRRNGLVFFGVFFLSAGLLAALADLGIALGRILPEETAHGLTRRAAGHLGLAALYAGTILVLGVGSMRARRWARAILLCGGGLACWGGLLAFAEICRMAGGGAESKPVLEGAALLLDGFLICLGAPIATVSFYWREDVHQTCLRRDARERWTDRLPLPVLACCLLQLLLAAIHLAAAVEGAPFPCFGFTLPGAGATAAHLLVFAFAVWAARGFYCRNRLAWRAYTGVFVVLSVAALAAQLSWLGGTPEAAGVELSRFRSPFGSHGSFGAAGSAVLDAVQLGYLLYARRFFFGRGRPAR